METSSQMNKERLLKMILKVKKKRKPAKTYPTLQIEGKSAVCFPDSVGSIWYQEKCENLRQELSDIAENF